MTSDFGLCSASCGGGFRERCVECYFFSNGSQIRKVALEYCQHFANQSNYPTSLTESCNNYACPEWRASEWSAVCILFLCNIKLLYIC